MEGGPAWQSGRAEAMGQNPGRYFEPHARTASGYLSTPPGSRGLGDGRAVGFIKMRRRGTLRATM